MNTPLKKLCIFGLAAGIGNMIIDQAPKILTGVDLYITFKKAQALSQAGQKAIESCHVRIDHGKLKKAYEKIDEICHNGEQFDIAKMLSFLFLGLNDLSHYSKAKTIKDVEDAALNFVVMYDPNLEDEQIHSEALKKYKEWIE